MRSWIGYLLADRLIGYPRARYLSACSLPIRVGPPRRGVPLGAAPTRAHYLSVCSLPIRVGPSRRGAPRVPVAIVGKAQAEPVLAAAPTRAHYLSVWVLLGAAPTCARYLSACLFPIREPWV